LTQEVAAVKQEPQEPSTLQEPKPLERKKQVSVQEIVESLKSTADDIGQISELSSEERILVTQFFSSLLKLMQPLSPTIIVDQLVLPAQLGDVVQAYIAPTGQLILQFQDDHVELKDLSEEKNRDLMMAVIGDVMPKFKGLTSMQKRKLENRIKTLSSITKEIQKSSEALSAALSAGK
jgi:proline dehydrogenase